MIQNTTSKPLTFNLDQLLTSMFLSGARGEELAQKAEQTLIDAVNNGKSDDEKKEICRSLERNRKLKRTVTREHRAVQNCNMEEIPGPAEGARWDYYEDGEPVLICNPQQRGGLRKIPFKNGTMMVCVMRGGRRVNIRAKDAKREVIVNDDGNPVGYEYLEPIYSEYRQMRSAQHEPKMTRRFKGSQKAFEIWCASNQIRMDDHVY